jgi:hypothetical protein
VSQEETPKGQYEADTKRRLYGTARASFDRRMLEWRVRQELRRTKQQSRHDRRRKIHRKES